MCKHLIVLVSIIIFLFAQDPDTLQQDTIKVKDQFPEVLNPIPKIACDSWFSQDKFLHFSACAAISGLTYHFYVNRLNKDEKTGKIYAVSITALIVIGK